VCDAALHKLGIGLFLHECVVMLPDLVLDLLFSTCPAAAVPCLHCYFACLGLNWLCSSCQWLLLISLYYYVSVCYPCC
jgi:hypothetical protein